MQRKSIHFPFDIQKLSSVMSAFLLAVNRICWNYGEEVQLTKNEKLLHAYKVLGEWQSAREQLNLEHIYNPEFGTHMEENPEFGIQKAG